MKRILLSLTVALLSISATASISNSKLREYARFLSDRMAYELDMTASQYDDSYEINLDFLYAINPLLNDMAYGYEDAIDRYYRYLDYRNDDMRYILTRAQYTRFRNSDYFYRPIYLTGKTWGFRIHTIYSNINFYYFDAPIIYKSYSGAHSRNHYSSSYYVNRYRDIDHHDVHHSFIGDRDYKTTRRADFGANIRQRNGNKYDINNYNNKNQSNRTRDQRYKDNSGNHNSPLINDRNNKSVNSRDNGAATTKDSPARSSSRSTSNSRTDNSDKRTTNNSDTNNTRSGGSRK